MCDVGRSALVQKVFEVSQNFLEDAVLLSTTEPQSYHGHINMSMIIEDGAHVKSVEDLVTYGTLSINGLHQL